MYCVNYQDELVVIVKISGKNVQRNSRLLSKNVCTIYSHLTIKIDHNFPRGSVYLLDIPHSLILKP